MFFYFSQCAVTSCDSLRTPTTTTSLAISISSPNLATNTSFSSSSDSDYLESAGGSGKSVITIQNLLDDNHSIDTNNNDDEPLNLAGENDVEYAELTQRMIFPNTPSNVSHQLLDNATSDSSDLMLMNLFDGHSESSSSSTHSTNLSTAIASRPVTSTSVLEKMNETALHHSSLNGANTNSSSTNLPSLDVSSNHDNNSLSHELTTHHASILSTSPVWKTQVSTFFNDLINLLRET